MDIDKKDIVTLVTKSGEEEDFVQLAGITYKGKYYAILWPLELSDVMDLDDALVFRVKRDWKGDDKFESETNDAIIDAVFNEFHRLLNELSK